MVRLPSLYHQPFSSRFFQEKISETIFIRKKCNFDRAQIFNFSWRENIAGWANKNARGSCVPLSSDYNAVLFPVLWYAAVNYLINFLLPSFVLLSYLLKESCRVTYTLVWRLVQTMEHIPQHSLTQQPRTWCSLVWTVSKYAANMLRISSEAELYCHGTNQKLSVFRTNTKAFLASVWMAFCQYGVPTNIGRTYI